MPRRSNRNTTIKKRNNPIKSTNNEKEQSVDDKTTTSKNKISVKQTKATRVNPTKLNDNDKKRSSNNKTTTTKNRKSTKQNKKISKQSKNTTNTSKHKKNNKEVSVSSTKLKKQAAKVRRSQINKEQKTLKKKNNRNRKNYDQKSEIDASDSDTDSVSESNSTETQTNSTQQCDSNNHNHNHNYNHKSVVDTSNDDQDASSQTRVIATEPPKKKRKFELLKRIRKKGKMDITLFNNSNVKADCFTSLTTHNDFSSLTTHNDFSDMNIIVYIVRISVIPNKRIIISAIQNGVLFMISGNQSLIDKHRNHRINKWYRLDGGKISVYKGVKQILISKLSKIIPVNKIGAATIDFRSKTNIIQDFCKLSTVQPNLRSQIYIAGHVDEIGKEQARGSKRVITLTIRDINGIGINVNLWNDDRQFAETIKINNTIVLTGWSLIETPTISINNAGVIFINQELPKAALVTKLIKNISSIDWSSIVINSPVFTTKQALYCATKNIPPTSQTGFVVIQNLKVIAIRQLFKFQDLNGKRLQERWGGRVMDENGVERNLDFNSDVISYSIQASFQHVATADITLYMNGFEQLGKDLFECTAKELYLKMEENNNEPADLVEYLKNQGMNVICSVYVNPLNSNLKWNIKKIESAFEIFSNDESQ